MTAQHNKRVLMVALEGVKGEPQESKLTQRQKQLVAALEPVKDFRLIWGFEEPIKVLRYHIARTGAAHIKVVLLKLSDGIEPLEHLISMQTDFSRWSLGFCTSFKGTNAAE